LVQQLSGGRAEEQKLSRPEPFAPSSIDLAAQHPEEIWQKLDLIDDNKAPKLFIKIKVWLFEDLTIRRPFKIKVHSVACLGYILSQRRLANLPWSQQDDASLAVQRLFNQFAMVPVQHNHAYHTSNVGFARLTSAARFQLRHFSDITMSPTNTHRRP
jgi:hypothetical protein